MTDAERAALEDWLPKASLDTFSSVPRTEDRRLSGLRWPPSEADVRRFAARPFLKCESGDANWFRNLLTMNSRRLVERWDALQSWENEGGQ